MKCPKCKTKLKGKLVAENIIYYCKKCGYEKID